MLESADVHVAQRLTALAEETDERVALAVALVVRGLARRVGVRGSALGRAAGRHRRAAVAGCRAGWRRCGRVRCSATRRCCASTGDLLYLDRYWREEQQVCDDLLGDGARRSRQRMFSTSERLFPAGLRGAAGSRGNRAVARVHGADGRPGHGQDHHRRAAAGAARRAGEAPAIAAAHRAGRADRQGRGAAAGGGAAGGRQAGAGGPAGAGRAAGDDAASAAGQQAGHVGAVPAPSR